TRRLSLVARSSNRAGRTAGGAYTKAERVMLTMDATRCAIWAARGPSSILKNTCSQAPRLTSINAASNKKDRLNKPSRILEFLLARRWAATAGRPSCCPEDKVSYRRLEQKRSPGPSPFE